MGKEQDPLRSSQGHGRGGPQGIGIQGSLMWGLGVGVSTKVLFFLKRHNQDNTLEMALKIRGGRWRGGGSWVGWGEGWQGLNWDCSGGDGEKGLDLGNS